MYSSGYKSKSSKAPQATMGSNGLPDLYVSLVSWVSNGCDIVPGWVVGYNVWLNTLYPLIWYTQAIKQVK